MAFTRDELTNYEKGAPAPKAAAPAPVSAPPAASTPVPVPDASSAPDAASVPADSGDASSAEPAATATATAEPDSSSTTDQTTTEPAAPASRSIPYERFQEVNDERNALKKYSAMLFERLEALQGQPPAETPAAPATAAAPTAASAEEVELPPEPSANEDGAAYNKRLAAWVRKIAEKTATAVNQRTQEQQTAAQVERSYLERESAFAAANPNFNVVTKAPLPRFARDTANTILTDPNGPAVVYHLAQHPDEAVRLSRMAPSQQLVRLGEILSQVKTPAASTSASKTSAPPPNKRTVTQAPPPPRPTPGGSAPTSRGMPPSMKEFAEQERAKKIAEREQRKAMRTAMR